MSTPTRSPTPPLVNSSELPRDQRWANDIFVTCQRDDLSYTIDAVMVSISLLRGLTLMSYNASKNCYKNALKIALIVDSFIKESSDIVSEQ